MFIVAEDPLRPETLPKEDIILATPFGTHIAQFRESKLKMNWQIVKHLLDNGYGVYQTDIFKLWLKQFPNNKIKFSKDTYNNFHKSLNKEMDVFQPELIITLGNHAFNAIQKLNLTSRVKVISFPHSAGTANGKWKELLSNDQNISQPLCTDENKLNYIVKELKNVLSQKV